MKAFLVYEHWRPDRGVCFYVGKGKKKRAHSFQRNSRHDRIVAKLRRLGLEPEVRIVHSVETNDEASTLEIERIAFWRAAGASLANYTNGGDGTPGYRFSAAQREKVRKRATGRILSAETRTKMAASRRGGKRTAETKSKMSASASVAQKARFKRAMATKDGRAEVRQRMIAIARKGRGSPEYSERKRLAVIAGWVSGAYQNRAIRIGHL